MARRDQGHALGLSIPARRRAFWPDGAAEKILREIVVQPSTSGELLVATRNLVPELRLQVERTARLIPRLESLLKREAGLAIDTLRERQDTLSRVAEEQAAALAKLKVEVATIEDGLRKQQEKDRLASSLAQLHEHGGRVGLQGGKCPLCGSAVTAAAFSTHLAELKATLDQTARKATELVQRRNGLADSERNVTAMLTTARREAEQLSMTLDALTQERHALQDEATQLRVPLEAFAAKTADTWRKEVEARKAQMDAVEKSLAVLESSKAHLRVAELEKELATAESFVIAAEKRVTRVQGAEQRVRNAVTSLKRISGEIVDDRLAAIQPLLAELYARLRPHVEWPDINYLIRGDTRRFLSLTVGGNEDLNLRFMFSSGQRRAAGLAFLLAVALSRPWCLLETLILDDPVQHIDDFRALHLVETLAALRQSGRQIICTVEDASLAELLARRLRSSETDEGSVVEMGYASGRGAHVTKSSEIRPFVARVLQSA